MQDIREKLRLALRQKGIDMAEVSRALGRNPTYIQQYITKGVPKKLDGDLRRQIAGYIGEQENYFDPEAPFQPQASSKVPVYGYAAGSAERVGINDGSIVGMRDRGNSLTYARNGFYVTVIGDSMEPRLRAGEYIAINPSLPPLRGDECVVEFNNGEAIVKTLVSLNDTTVTLSQYNPPKTLELARTEIGAVWPVVAIEKGR